MSWHRPVFLVNSRQIPFTAAPGGLHPKGHPLSRSYGVNLPSSFTSVLSSALEYSSRLPVSVLVRARHCPAPAFLGVTSGDFGIVYALALAGPPSSRGLALPSHVLVPSTAGSGAGILTCRPSSTPFGLD